MSNNIPLLGPRIATLDALSFLAHVKSLIVYKETKASKAVPDITLTWGKRKILRINRENKKTLLLTEVEALAKEKDITSAELIELLTQRKIEVRDENGLWINEWAAKPVRRRRASDDQNAETNAKPRARRKRKSDLSNKLIEPVDHAGMHEESAVRVISGAQE